MMSTRNLDTQSLLNVVINGAFDHLETVGNNLIPHFWEFANIAAPRDTGKSEDTFTVVRGESLARKGDLRDYLVARLATKLSATMTQSFLIDSKVALDFPVPLIPGTIRREVGAGYLSRYDTFLARSNSFTVGISTRVRLGSASITASFLDINKSPIATAELMPASSAASTKQLWRRYAAKLTPEFTPAYVKLTITRSSPTEYLELNLGNIQLVCGAYDSVPYTGDRLLSAIPPDVVVLSLGSGCPPGFVELEEPSGVSVPDSWAAQDATLMARRNLYPIGTETAVNPSQLVGDPTHNRSSYKFRVSRNGVEAFESFDALTTVTSTAVGVQSGSTITTTERVQTAIAADEAPSGIADHQHNVSAGGSIPVTRSFRFCRKI